MKMLFNFANCLFDFIKRTSTMPNALALARKELEQAKKGYLQAITHAEHYEYQVKFELGRIKRLQQYILDNSND